MNRFATVFVVLLGACSDDPVNVNAITTCDYGEFADECETACKMVPTELDYETPCRAFHEDEELIGGCRPTFMFMGHTGCCTPMSLGDNTTRYRFFECFAE